MTGREKNRPGDARRGFRRRWKAKARAGVATVELGFALPVFVFLLYGVIELSHYIFTDIALADAARIGARYAMVHGATASPPASAADISTYLKSRVALLDPTQITAVVTFSPNNSPGSAVQVRLSYPFVPFLPGFDIIMATTLTGSSQVTIAH